MRMNSPGMSHTPLFCSECDPRLSLATSNVRWMRPRPCRSTSASSAIRCTARRATGADRFVGMGSLLVPTGIARVELSEYSDGS